MYKQKLCLGLFGQDKLSHTEQVKLFSDTGFEGFFAGYGSDISSLRRAADDTGMIFQSIHADFTKMDAMWEKDNRSQTALDELIDCARIYAQPIVMVLGLSPLAVRKMPPLASFSFIIPIISL